ncbi:MAG: hypothetical protein PGN12_03900 [Sphingomonas phyllosphaerae]
MQDVAGGDQAGDDPADRRWQIGFQQAEHLLHDDPVLAEDPAGIAGQRGGLCDRLIVDAIGERLCDPKPFFLREVDHVAAPRSTGRKADA